MTRITNSRAADLSIPLVDSARLLARVRKLVEVESPSDDKAAVDRCMTVAAEMATALGGSVKIHRQKRYGNVLELRFGHRRGVKPVLLLGHLDTVWPHGTLAKMPLREVDGKLYGPGTLDMKVGVSMAFEAIASLTNSRRLRPVTLLLVSEEEIGSPISRPITEKLALASSAVFVLEPAQGLAYKTARKGVGHYDLRVEGVSAHAGVEPEKGHSAIHEMARLIAKITGLSDPAHGLTVNVGVIQGGTKSNVVAAECTAEVDVRVVTMRQAATIDRAIRALKPADKLCKLTITGGINRPPMERKAGTIALFKRARKLAAEIGFALDEAATGGGSDGNFTAAVGVPTLDGMGAIGAGAHANHEHIVLSHLEERTKLLAAMIATQP
ncbi:glutamate carboxypeptidase [Bryocella elongata]|uniref:Glutamate carboxypeptidase n=1 Tax=Bryocella elongata TaxID=863522 RepID=A0A1H5Y3Y6_9BACT|nr:M20 family metallopeptidase [Bryocella elongata]SEG18724.1 glutamate carboxypeptidase [Bryocella elongata]